MPEGEAQGAEGAGTEARTARADLESQTVAFGPSMEAIVERDNLKKALAQVKRNKGAPGVDAMRIAPQALARFKARVRELTRRTKGASLAQTIEELSRYLIGWRGYFGFCETPSVLRALDEWIRRRLRAIAWKQWKRGRTRFAELHQRGVGLNLAAQTSGSPHGPWRLSNSPALNMALPKASLRNLGLASLADQCAA